jgi:hypothetical protein
VLAGRMMRRKPTVDRPHEARESTEEEAVAQYSSGPIGRLVWQDVVGLVQHAKKQA